MSFFPGLRFRKTIKIAGIRINITKSGVSSLSIGKKGATVNIGKSGITTTVGIPGSGISYRKKILGFNLGIGSRSSRTVSKNIPHKGLNVHAENSYIRAATLATEGNTKFASFCLGSIFSFLLFFTASLITSSVSNAMFWKIVLYIIATYCAAFPITITISGILNLLRSIINSHRYNMESHRYNIESQRILSPNEEQRKQLFEDYLNGKVTPDEFTRRRAELG